MEIDSLISTLENMVVDGIGKHKELFSQEVSLVYSNNPLLAMGGLSSVLNTVIENDMGGEIQKAVCDEVGRVIDQIAEEAGAIYAIKIISSLHSDKPAQYEDWNNPYDKIREEKLLEYCDAALNQDLKGAEGWLCILRGKIHPDVIAKTSYMVLSHVSDEGVGHIDEARIVTLCSYLADVLTFDDCLELKGDLENIVGSLFEDTYSVMGSEGVNVFKGMFPCMISAVGHCGDGILDAHDEFLKFVEAKAAEIIANDPDNYPDLANG